MKNILQCKFVFCYLFFTSQLIAQDTWEFIGPDSISIYSFAARDSFLFASTNCNEGGIFLTTNEGDTWTELSSGLPGDLIAAGSFIKQIPAVSVCGDGIEWIDISEGLPPNGTIYSVMLQDPNIYAGTIAGVYKFNVDAGIWEPSNAGLSNRYVQSLGQNETHLFAGTNRYGIYRSDDGQQWTEASGGLPLDDTLFKSFAFHGSNVFAAASGETGGTYHSTDNGDNWHELNSGLSEGADVNALTIQGAYIHAGFNDFGIFRRQLSEFTSTEEIVNENFTNKNLILFPNPGDGKFTISISSESVSDKDFASSHITCYTSLGRNVFAKEYLLNNGVLDTELDFSTFANGVYWLQLRNGEQSIFRKVIISR